MKIFYDVRDDRISEHPKIPNQTRVFFDVDTQNDFMNSSGSLYVPDAELIKPNLALLTEYARRNRIAIVGSVDSHVENDPEFKVFPPHCIKGTRGQEKIKETTLLIDAEMGVHPGVDGGIYIPNKLVASPLELVYAINDVMPRSPQSLNDKRGMYFEKQSYDIFTNPNFARFLELAEVKEAVVYGVATDFCVKAAVLGMQNRGIQTYVVEDAIRGVFPDKSKEALEEMAKSGAKFTTTKDVLEGKL